MTVQRHDVYKPVGKQGKWGYPPELYDIPAEMPKVDNNQFVEWLYNAVLNQPEDAFGYEATKLLRDLNIGAVVDHGIVDPISRDKVFENYKNRANNKIVIEKIRTGLLSLAPEKFIEVANGKEN